MPLDNSNTQSFRTHRLKCKAAAATPGPITNEQTISNSSFVNYKLGKMPYIVQPASGGPVTTDAGCCGGECDALCTTVLTARYIAVNEYSTIATLFGLTPLPGTYTYPYVAVLMFKSCGNTHNIQQIYDPEQSLSLQFNNIYVSTNVNVSMLLPINIPVDVLTVLFTQSYSPLNPLRIPSLLVTGTVQPCNQPILD